MSPTRSTRAHALIYSVVIISIIVLSVSLYTLVIVKNSVEEVRKAQEDLQTKLSNINNTIEQLTATTLNLSLLYSDSLKDLNDLRQTVNAIANETERLRELALFPVTIVDSTGDPITIATRPNRIVSLLPSVTEILWLVGAAEQVIAVDDQSNYPHEVEEALANGSLRSIGSGWYPDVEAILSMNPDLVIGVDSVQSHHTLKDILSDYGIPVLLLPDYNLNDIIESILLVGRATGHPIEAVNLAINVRSTIISLRADLTDYVNQTGIQPPRVAVFVWLYPLWVVGNSTWMNDVIFLSGGVNAYAEMVTGWQAVDPESLLETMPDVILVTTGHGAINMTTEEFIQYLQGEIGDAVYSIPAISDNRIYFISGDYEDALVRPGPRVTDAVKLISLVLFPRFYGMDPESIPHLLDPNTVNLP